MKSQPHNEKKSIFLEILSTILVKVSTISGIASAELVWFCQLTQYNTADESYPFTHLPIYDKKVFQRQMEVNQLLSYSLLTFKYLDFRHDSTICKL